jgi:hypothetical protein
MENKSELHRYEEGKKEFITSFVNEKSVLLDGKSEEEQKAILVRLKREAEIIYDEALRFFVEKENAKQKDVIDLQVALVQLPEVRAQEITDRIIEAERTYSPDTSVKGYDTGSATVPDELKVTEGSRPVLLTAEHATTHIRKGQPKEADWGTGGLVDVLATDHGTFAITTLGMQTGDPNFDESHRLKEKAGLIIVQNGMRLALSIHGIGGGKFVTEAQKSTGQTSELAIGIGRNYTVESAEFAEWLQTLAKSLDIRADINPWYLALDSEGRVRSKDSIPLRNSFRADKPYTTRSHMQREASDAGLLLPIAQIELGSELRVGPDTSKIIPEKIFKAYLLLTQAIAKFA